MKPILQALLMADHVYVDAATKKKIVAGIFHKLVLFPPKLEPVPGPEGEYSGESVQRIQIPVAGQKSGSPFCYLSVTEVYGKQAFTLRYVNLDDDKAIFQTEFQLEGKDPLETIEFVLPLPELPSKAAGHYALELLWGLEPLGCHRITIEKSSTTES